MLFTTWQIIFTVLGFFMCTTTGYSDDDEMCIPIRRHRGCGSDSSEIQFRQETLHKVVASLFDNPATSTYLVATCSVGVKDGTIRDNQITSSSIHSSPFTFTNGRLDYPGSTSPFKEAAAWVPKSVVGEWIQVDLENPTRVTGVVTQGRGDTTHGDQWVLTFKVSYGNSPTNMQVIKSSNGNDKIFQGNRDRNSYVINKFPNPITARYFRIIVQTWVLFPSLRFDYITC